MPDKFQAYQPKVIVLKFIQKNMELRAFIPSPFSTPLNSSVTHFLPMLYSRNNSA